MPKDYLLTLSAVTTQKHYTLHKIVFSVCFGMGFVLHMGNTNQNKGANHERKHKPNNQRGGRKNQKNGRQ